MTKAELFERIDENEPRLKWVAQDLWENPELGLHEERSAEVLMAALDEGFDSQAGVGGMPTAFVVFYGCPAEETLVGKTSMARAGVFDDLDATLTWHPATRARRERGRRTRSTRSRSRSRVSRHTPPGRPSRGGARWRDLASNRERSDPSEVRVTRIRFRWGRA